MTLDTARCLLPISHRLDRPTDGLLYIRSAENGKPGWHDRLRERLGLAALGFTGHWRW